MKTIFFAILLLSSVMAGADTGLNLNAIFSGTSDAKDKNGNKLYVEVQLSNSLAKVQIGNMHFETVPKLEDESGGRLSKIALIRNHDSYGNYIPPNPGQQYVYEFETKVKGDKVVYYLKCTDVANDPMRSCENGTELPLELFSFFAQNE